MLKNKSGQVLIEGMVAMSIITISVLGIFSLAITSWSIGRTTSDQFIAANLAGEGLEIAKNILDSNVQANRSWNAGAADGLYEVDYQSTDFSHALNNESNAQFLKYGANNQGVNVYSYSFGTDTKFKRYIKLENLDNGNRILATAKVVFPGKLIKEVVVATEFLNWR